MGKLALFTVLLITILLPLGSVDAGSEKRLCGRALREALRVICNSDYNSLYHRYKYTNVQQNADPAYANVRIDGVSKIRRKRSGVATECCKKPCSYRELTSYCSYPQL